MELSRNKERLQFFKVNCGGVHSKEVILVIRFGYGHWNVNLPFFPSTQTVVLKCF